MKRLVLTKKQIMEDSSLLFYMDEKEYDKLYGFFDSHLFIVTIHDNHKVTLTK